jgi:hypothetical protein
MPDVFISHIGEDGNDARNLAEQLRHARYSTWYYERDARSGLSYVSQVMTSIEESQAFIIIISNGAFSSPQIDAELLHAFEKMKSILPLLKNMTFADFERQRPDWKFQLRGQVARLLPGATTHDLISDLEAMGIRPSQAVTDIHPPQPVPASEEQILVRLRLIPPEENHREFVSLALSGELHCSYRVSEGGGSFSAPYTAHITALAGGLFVIIREVSRDAIVQLELESDGRSWESRPLLVDAVPAHIFRKTD